MSQSFRNVPAVLVLALNRVRITRWVPEKLSQVYEFPEGFDATPYPSADACQFGPWTYTLYSLIVHQGTLRYGGYYVFLRPTKDGPFYKFDNDIVTPATLEEAINANFGGTASPQNASAYILIYIRKSRLQVLVE